jgi:hypothetical protein
MSLEVLPILASIFKSWNDGNQIKISILKRSIYMYFPIKKYSYILVR